YDNLRKYPIPLLEQAIRAIGASSLALDLYVWLSYRLHSLTKPTTISWQALHAQHGAEYARIRDFKRFMIPQLKLALAAYPQAGVTLEEDGLMLYPSAPPISKLGG
ncbi:pirin, partial [Niveispirillum sp. SYP-B3756]|uniref:replication protein RepA n=1 Tax=Niveispirillum sp. SYP-B3756 TaxID=2662178 RepID=UPI00135EB764